MWCSSPPGSPARRTPASNGAPSDGPSRIMPPQDRVAAQRAERLAGHVRGEADDPAAPRRAPISSGSPAGRPARCRPSRRSTPNTCVSSPRITSATPASSVADRPGTSFTCAQSNSISDQRRGDLRRAGGAGQVGRLLPALPAADHAGQQHVVLAGGEPGADLLAQRVGEAVVGHVERCRAGRRGGRGWCRRAPCGRRGSWWCPSRRRSWTFLP